jgi:hypothetical protein
VKFLFALRAEGIWNQAQPLMTHALSLRPLRNHRVLCAKNR